MTGATFAISEAVWAAGEFKKKVIEAPQRERALVTVRIRTENVAGVKLPVFTLNSSQAVDAESEVLGLAGACGGRVGAPFRRLGALLVVGWVGVPSPPCVLPTTCPPSSRSHVRRRATDWKGAREVYAPTRGPSQAGVIADVVPYAGWCFEADKQGAFSRSPHTHTLTTSKGSPSPAEGS